MSSAPAKGSKSYEKKVKDVNDNFVQNAAGVQGMINDVESEIYQLLKKKEKLREKLVGLRESKRLDPTMGERGAVLLDDLADFSNQYNHRQPATTRVASVPVSSDRPVLGDGPKLLRHLVMEMNPAEVVTAATPAGSPATAGGAANASPGSPASTATPAASPAAPESGASSGQQQNSPNFTTAQPDDTRSNASAATTANNTAVSEPSIAVSFGVSFAPMTEMPGQPQSGAAAAAAAASSSASPPGSPTGGSTPSGSTPRTAGAALSVSGAAANSGKLEALPDALAADEVPVLGIKFRLMLPQGTSAETIRKALQDKVDSHVNEIKTSIDQAQKALSDAVDAEEDKEEEDKKKGQDNVDLHDVGDLLWKSLRLVVGVKRGPVVYQATMHIVTIYVYRVLSAEQRARQAELEAAVEARLSDAIKSAHAEDELQHAKEAAAAAARGRSYRQLSAVARLCADCNVSVNAELQVTAQKNPDYAPSVAAAVEAGAGAAEQKKDDDIETNTKSERSAEGILSRVLESAPRVEAALREAVSALTEASEKTTGEDARRLARSQAEALYRESILPAFQRMADPDDLIVALINKLAAEDKECPLRPRAIPGEASPKVAKIVATSASASATDDKKEAQAEEEEDSHPPFLISLNAHHVELCNVPKQIVRQTANMIYDYFLDTTESLSGRAYVGMCRRRTLAGVALYDALHFNIVPLQRGGKSEQAKSACAFYHFEKLFRKAVVNASERAVQQVLDAREKVTKAIDGADGGQKESIFSSTVSTLKLAMRIGKRLFSKFQEEREKKSKSEEQDDDAVGEETRTNAFAFVNGEICCCDTSRPLEIEMYMPDAKAVATFRTVLRPAVPDFVSPRIRPKRSDAKNPVVQSATMRASSCRGHCTALIPEFGLQVGDAFATLWLGQLQDFIGEHEDKLPGAAGDGSSAAAAAAAEEK